MDKLPCDMVILFSRDGKFVWETDIDEGEQGQSVDNLISACNKIYAHFGDDLDWEIGVVSLRKGNGFENLGKEIRELSVKLKKIFNN